MPLRRIGRDLGTRFVYLTVIGYIFALVVTLVAVKVGSGPALQRMQAQALSDQAISAARGARHELEAIVRSLGAASAQHDVVSFVIGDKANPDWAMEVLSGLSDPANVNRATVFDFQGDVLLEATFDAFAAFPFFSSEIRHSVASLLGATDPRPQVHFRPSPDTGVEFLIVLPVLRFGAVEGALAFEVSSSLDALFGEPSRIGSAELATGFQLAMASDWGGRETHLVRRLGDYDVFAVFQPDPGAVSAIGSELVSRVLIALCGLLSLPFGLMCALGYRAIVTPNRALEQSQKALKEKHEDLFELAAIADRAHDAIAVIDVSGDMVWANASVEELTGKSREALIGRNAWQTFGVNVMPVRDRVRVMRAVAKRQLVRFEFETARPDGSRFWAAVRLAPLADTTGQVHRFVLIANDITETKTQEAALRAANRKVAYEASHDHLTALPNRRSLDAALEALSGGENRVLIRIDLDHFKTVNDTLGHAAGDAVLHAVSRRLERQLHATDLAARVGGDEFVILLGKGRAQADAIDLSQKLLDALQADIEIDGRGLRIGASFGIASTDDGLIGTRELLLSADAALYEAKAKGRNTVVVYSQELHARVMTLREQTAEVERALHDGAFEPFYQPQIDARTGRVVGVEALARWRHPQKGLLTPPQFLPAVEHLSLLGELDSQIFVSGLKDMNALASEGLAIPKISFNVIATRLERADLAGTAGRYGPSETKIAFEVLESVLVEEQSQLFHFQIDKLKDLGFQLEIDDFGSGHASIIGLMQLKPDVMKIDQRLIRPITDSETAQQMVAAIVEIGRALGIRITAEGVETAAHAQILTSLGCDTLQGYHFAKPMPFDDLRHFVKIARSRPNVPAYITP